MENNPSSEEEPSLTLRDTNNVDLNNETLDLAITAHLEIDPLTQPVNPLEIDPFIGMEFESEESAKLFYMSYASRIGFSVRISKSRRSRNDESIIMRRFVCSKEGFHLKKNNDLDDGKKKRKRATIREGCNAMIEVIQKYYGRWVVSKLIKDHNHIIEAPSRVRFIAPEEYAQMEPFLGMEFSSHESAQTFYYAYASRIGFDVRIRLSRRSNKDESFVMRRFVCVKEGFTPSEDNNNGDDNNINNNNGKKRKNRTPIREGCKAMFEVVRKEFDKWVVSKLVLEHTHDLNVLNNKVHYIQSQSEVVVLAKTPQIGDQLGAVSNNTHKSPSNANSNDNHINNNNNVFWNENKKRNNFSFGLDDTQKFLGYLKRMNAENPTFSYAFQVDKNNCLTHAFWADARARASYYYFGDAVTVDTDFKANYNLLPFIMFTGVNHHMQSVLFGCALIVDQNEDSFVWLLENWVASMGAHHPTALKTVHDDVIGSAISRVFPDTRHVFCEREIFQKCEEKLGHLFSIYPLLKGEFTNLIKETQTVEEFESAWNLMLEKYDLGDNSWLQYLYNIRVKWVPVFLKDTFTGEISSDFKPESLRETFFEKYFNVKTPLHVFITLFDHAMSGWSERESLEDLASSFTKPVLNFPSNLLKQMSEIYTRSIYNLFEKEFVESLGYYVERIEDGLVSKYKVTKEGDIRIIFKVIYDLNDKRARCSCGKFEACGILCRHILRVFLMIDLRSLPEFYILKRWTKEAKNGFVLDESLRFNELYRDAVRFAKEGSTSGEVFGLAQQNLQVAFSEVYQMKQDMINRCAMR